MKSYRKLLNSLFLLFSLSILTGCPLFGPTVSEGLKEDCFVREYFEVSNLFLNSIGDNVFTISYDKSDCKYVSLYSKTKEEKTKYRSLCTKYGDTNFPHRYKSTQHDKCAVISQDFQRVDIICLNDYDKEHKAGSSLQDISTFYSTSLYPFLKSGYISFEHHEKIKQIESPILDALYPKQFIHSEGYTFRRSEFMPNHLIAKKISQLKREDLLMIGGQYPELLPIIAVIKLDKSPTQPGKHDIQVVFIKDNGESIKASGTILFK